MVSDIELAKLYCRSLDEIRERLALVRSICDGSVTTGSEAFDYEIVSVNFRKILELIAFGALTANKDAYATAYAKYEKHWMAKQLLECLEKVHPDFYPTALIQPVISNEIPRKVHFELVADGFLTRDEFVELYNLCSGVIHSRNPFAPQSDINFRIPVKEWAARVETLLRFHIFRLVGLPQVWVGELCAPGDGKAHVYVANTS